MAVYEDNQVLPELSGQIDRLPWRSVYAPAQLSWTLERMQNEALDQLDRGYSNPSLGGFVSTVLGLDILGEGHFGVCLALDEFLGTTARGERFVLKVTASDDDCYPVWAEFCAQNPGPHIPDIICTGWVSDLFWAIMPAYDPVMDAVGEAGDRSLVEAAEVYRDLFGEVATWDLHNDNYMYDPYQGRYVITDPLSFMRMDRDEALVMYGSRL